MSTEWGAIERYSEADWMLGSVIERTDIADAEFRFYDKTIEYNQDEYKQNTCTVYAAMWAYSDLRWIEIPFEKRKEIIDLAIDGWLDVNEWWRLHKAVKLVADYFWDVSYARIILGSEDENMARNKWYTIISWYKWNREYNLDRDDDWIVQKNERWEPTYWHAPRFVALEEVADNYKKRATNIYRLPELEKKIEWGNMFRYGYFYFNKISMSPIVNLPMHISPDSVRTPARKEIVVAREQEATVWLQKWNQLSYSEYMADNEYDEWDVISRMLIDLKTIRG